MHIWTNFWKFHSYMHEFPLVHKIHKFDHGDDLVIMAMTDCWSFMIAYIIMSSWNISWPLPGSSCSRWGSGTLHSLSKASRWRAWGRCLRPFYDSAWRTRSLHYSCRPYGTQPGLLWLQSGQGGWKENQWLDLWWLRHRCPHIGSWSAQKHQGGNGHTLGSLSRKYP